MNTFAKDLQYQQSQQSRKRVSSRPSVGPFESLNIVSNSLNSLLKGAIWQGKKMDLDKVTLLQGNKAVDMEYSDRRWLSQDSCYCDGRYVFLYTEIQIFIVVTWIKMKNAFRWVQTNQMSTNKPSTGPVVLQVTPRIFWFWKIFSTCVHKYCSSFNSVRRGVSWQGVLFVCFVFCFFVFVVFVFRKILKFTFSLSCLNAK